MGRPTKLSVLRPREFDIEYLAEVNRATYPVPLALYELDRQRSFMQVPGEADDPLLQTVALTSNANNGGHRRPPTL